MNCAICQDSVNQNDDSAILTTICGHTFHTTCFFQYIYTMGTTESLICPLCRHSLLIVEHEQAASVEVTPVASEPVASNKKILLNILGTCGVVIVIGLIIVLSVNKDRL